MLFLSQATVLPSRMQTVPVIIVERTGIFKQLASAQNDEPSSSRENNPFLGEIHNAKRSNKERSIEICLDNTFNFNFKIDKGADVDIISDKIYTSHFSHKLLLRSTKNLKGPDRKDLPIIRYIKCSISKGDKSIQSDVYVCM